MVGSSAQWAGQTRVMIDSYWATYHTLKHIALSFFRTLLRIIWNIRFQEGDQPLQMATGHLIIHELDTGDNASSSYICWFIKVLHPTSLGWHNKPPVHDTSAFVIYIQPVRICCFSILFLLLPWTLPCGEKPQKSQQGWLRYHEN